jgi:hypothetical protein
MIVLFVTSVITAYFGFFLFALLDQTYFSKTAKSNVIHSAFFSVVAACILLFSIVVQNTYFLGNANGNSQIDIRDTILQMKLIRVILLIAGGPVIAWLLSLRQH